MSRVNNLFTGTIDGLSQKDMYAKVVKLDRTKGSIIDRRAIVENVLNSTDFFVDYFSNNFNVHFNAQSELSSKNNVCNLLEMMGTYLIMSDESRQMSKDENTIYIFTDEIMDKKIHREMFAGINESGQPSNLLDDQRVQIVARPKNRNDVVFKHQIITQKDLNEKSYTGEVLRSYQSGLDNLNYRIEHKIGNRYQNTLQKHLITQDMIDAKNMLKGVWGEKSVPRYPQVQKHFDIFDLTDPNTVRAVLALQGDFYESFDLWLMAIDLDQIGHRAGFTDEERIVYFAIRTGFSFKDISELAHIDYRRLMQTVVNNVCTKILMLREKYDAADPAIASAILYRKTFNRYAEPLLQPAAV